MPASNSSGVVSTAVFIDCLKLFQEHPEQFPLDLRAKFCGCSQSSAASSVCEEYSKQQNKIKQPISQPPKIQRQESGEFISTASEPSTNVTQLTNVAEELKNILQEKLNTRSMSNDSRKIPSGVGIRSKREESKVKPVKIPSSSSIRSFENREIDVMRAINYLITHPEKIPVQAVHRLCKIAANLPLRYFKSSKRSRDTGSTTASETLHSGSEASRMTSSSKAKNGTGKSTNIVEKHLLDPPSSSLGGNHSIKKSPSSIQRRTSPQGNHENQKKKQSSRLHKGVTTASQKRSARSDTNTSTSTAISSTTASPSPSPRRSFKAKKRKSARKRSSTHRMHRDDESSLTSASTSRSRSKSPHVKNHRLKTTRKKRRSEKEERDVAGTHTISAPITSSSKSFSQTKLGTAKQPVQTKAQFQLTQPALIQEKLNIHQPIPFMIFRLCCPPGMIPLTSKVAERLGINVTMFSQQSPSKIDGIIQEAPILDQNCAPLYLSKIFLGSCFYTNSYLSDRKWLQYLFIIALLNTMFLLYHSRRNNQQQRFFAH